MTTIKNKIEVIFVLSNQSEKKKTDTIKKLVTLTENKRK